MYACISRSVALLCLLAPAAASAHGSSRDHRYDGYVRVENETGEALTVRVDGNDARVLGPWETARFRADSGYVVVSASYRAFGESRLLVNKTVKVYRGRTADVELRPPSTTLVKVVNNTGVPAELRSSGREVVDLAPSQSRIVSLPVGSASLELVANGRIVEHEHLYLRPFEEETITGFAPSRADLVVYNPLPFPVALTCDRGLTRTVEPRGRVVYDDVAVGSFHLVARRPGGERVDEEQIRIDPWRGGSWTIDPPSQGLVRLDNEHHEGVRVYADGRIIAMLNAEQDHTLSLPLGPVTLEVRELDGTLVDLDAITVDPYRTTTVEFGWDRRPGYTSGQHRPHDDDHDHYHGTNGHSCTM
ncbi:MAG: hypothetical protein FJ090_03515 [Deltaproteobacteria bacterium]|nr:hypothetical protein [Deltaproteobacteria bacterium]